MSAAARLTCVLWHPQDGLALLGRLTFPLSMFAYPFYLLNRSPGKQGSHYDPKTDLFSDIEGPMVCS